MENAATVDAAGPVMTSQEVAAVDEIAAQPEQDEESAPSQSDSTDGPPEKKVTGGFQKRIETLTRQKHEAAQALEAERREKEELKRQLAQQQGQSAPKAPADEAPKESDYTDYLEFLRAEARYTARQEAKATAKAEREAAEQERAQKSVAEQASKRQQAFAVAVEMASATVPDFEQVANSVTLSPELGQALLASDKGAAVLYHLGLNPDEAERIVNISKGDPVRAAIEIARLESKAEATLQTRTRSKAPRQAAPLGGGGGVRDDAPSTNDSMEEFAKKWYAQRRKG